MPFLACWRLRRQLTCYADGELASVERGVVDQHLAICGACRQRVRIERAVRQGLRERTARAGSSAWLAPPPFPASPSATGRWRKPAALAVGASVLLVLWSATWDRMFRVTAQGVISDSYCNGVHRPSEAPDASPVDCIQGCLRKGAHYVFVAGETVYTIRNPDFAGLPANLGRMVHASGTAWGQQLTLAHVTALR